MRIKYTVINLLVSVGGQLFSILLSFISRMFFIHYLSAEYLGLNGLFTDVLGILDVYKRQHKSFPMLPIPYIA